MLESQASAGRQRLESTTMIKHLPILSHNGSSTTIAAHDLEELSLERGMR